MPKEQTAQVNFMSVTSINNNDAIYNPLSDCHINIFDRNKKLNHIQFRKLEQ